MDIGRHFWGLSLIAVAVLARAEPLPAGTQADGPPLRLNLSVTRSLATDQPRHVDEPLRLSAPAPLWQRLSVVEVPAQNVPGVPPGRAHHALRIATDAPKPLLRSLGIDASDCGAQFRAPSQVKQARGAVTMDVQAQVRLGCRF